jgi:hypothetical protein
MIERNQIGYGEIPNRNEYDSAAKRVIPKPIWRLMTPRNRSIPDFQTVLYGRLVLKDDSFHKRERTA